MPPTITNWLEEVACIWQNETWLQSFQGIGKNQIELYRPVWIFWEIYSFNHHRISLRELTVDREYFHHFSGEPIRSQERGSRCGRSRRRGSGVKAERPPRARDGTGEANRRGSAPFLLAVVPKPLSSISDNMMDNIWLLPAMLCNSRCCFWFQIRKSCLSVIAETKAICQDIFSKWRVPVKFTFTVLFCTYFINAWHDNFQFSAAFCCESFHTHHESLVYLSAPTVRMTSGRASKGQQEKETARKICS